MITIFSFDPMWETMRKKGITQYQLIVNDVVDRNTLHRLKKNENVTLMTVDKICRALQCDISQVVQIQHTGEPERLRGRSGRKKERRKSTKEWTTET